MVEEEHEFYFFTRGETWIEKRNVVKLMSHEIDLNYSFFECSFVPFY